MLKYTVMRLALFVAALAVAIALGAGPLTAVVVAGLVSAALSYLFLRGPRDDVAQVLADRVERRLERPGGFADRMREDEQLEDAAVEQAEPRTEPRTEPRAE